MPQKVPFDIIKKYSKYLSDRVSEYISRASHDIDSIYTINDIRLARFSLDWLTFQQQLISTAVQCSKSNKWISLQGLIEYCSKMMEISDPTLGVFSTIYGATGAFDYYNRIDSSSDIDYFIILVHEFDPPIFWSLAIHEIAHCWLSSKDVVMKISKQIHSGLDIKYQEGRIEEAICDAIATSFIGPPYPFAYIECLWPVFNQFADEHPHHSFRVHLMTEVLRENGFNKTANDIEEIARNILVYDWADEEIVDSIDLIKEAACQTSFKFTLDSMTEIDYDIVEFTSQPPNDVRCLFNVGWKLINNAPDNRYFNVFESVSNIIQMSLEGKSTAFKP